METRRGEERYHLTWFIHVPTRNLDSLLLGYKDLWALLFSM
jgi:hypothetical protein